MSILIQFSIWKVLRPPTSRLFDAALRSILRYDPNASLQTTTDTFSISPEIVCTHRSRIDCTMKFLRWIHHELAIELKQICFDLCLHLPPKLRAHAQDNWWQLVTRNASWFYYEDVRGWIWSARDENTRKADSRTIASTKTILMVLWNPHSFHVVTIWPPGELSNASRFIDQDLVPLGQSFFPSGPSPKQKINGLYRQCRDSWFKNLAKFFEYAHWSGSLIHFTHQIYLPRTFTFLGKRRARSSEKRLRMKSAFLTYWPKFWMAFRQTSCSTFSAVGSNTLKM
jgi:hypothetical protein